MKEKMKRFYKEVFFFVFALVAFGYLNEYMGLKDNEVKLNNYIGTEGKTPATLNLKFTGLKKAGRSMLWLKQILDVGGHERDTEQQKLNSEMISYLDPYFKVNYYYAASVLALIRTNNRHDYGLQVLYRGYKYNQNDRVMPLYIAGIAADQANDLSKTLEYFEKIVKKIEDEQLIHTIAYIYDEKYANSQEIKEKAKYMKKAISYYEQLLYSKQGKYKEKAEKKLRKYYKNLKKDN